MNETEEIETGARDSAEEAPSSAATDTPESTLLERAGSLTSTAVDLGKTLVKKVGSDVDPKRLAKGVAGMTAGEGLGSAIGGVIGSVGGPIGTALGAQLGSMAGGSLGAKYAYEWNGDNEKEALPSSETNPQSLDDSGIGKTLTSKAANAMGESIGKHSGEAIGRSVGGAAVGQVIGTLGEALGGAAGTESIREEEQPGEEGSKSSYRKAPTRAWFSKIAKEKLTETALAGVFGGLGQLIGGPIGGRIGSKAGSVASSRINWAEKDKEEFVEIQGSSPEASTEDLKKDKT